MPGRRHLSLVALTVLAAAILLGACGGGGGSSSTAVPPLLPNEVGIEAKSLSWNPEHVTVKQGQTVVWRFQDTVAHNVVADTFRSKDILKGVYKHTFDQPGKYSFKCTIHPTMTGDVTVQ
jgi:plastocyanin